MLVLSAKIGPPSHRTSDSILSLLFRMVNVEENSYHLCILLFDVLPTSHRCITSSFIFKSKHFCFVAIFGFEQHKQNHRVIFNFCSLA
jgi:hypothetical protein